MRWKDSGDAVPKKEDARQEYFDEEQYSPWADRTASRRTTILSKRPVLYLLLVVAIVSLVAALLMLFGNRGADAVPNRQLTAIEERLLRLEEKLHNYEAINEKLARIGEQTDTFENFKDRFDHSEASIALRMDSLTTRFKSLKKQLDARQKLPAAKSPPVTSTAGKQTSAARKQTSVAGKQTSAAAGFKYYVVQAGDTPFGISKKFGLKVDQLFKMNRMPSESTIYPGQKLIVGTF